MPKYNLPVDYTKLDRQQRRAVRLQYMEEQKGLCYYCKEPLDGPCAPDKAKLKVRPYLYPKGFFENPCHLHHSHDTDLTIGAVHAYCNAVLWEHHGE